MIFWSSAQIVFDRKTHIIRWLHIESPCLKAAVQSQHVNACTTVILTLEIVSV